MDLAEAESEFVLKADLPGLTEEDVNIELEDNVLTISGERKSEHEDRKDGYRRIERSFGSFRRSLTLPEGVDPEAVKAQLRSRCARDPRPKARAAQAAQGRDQRRRPEPPDDRGIGDRRRGVSLRYLGRSRAPGRQTRAAGSGQRDPGRAGESAQDAVCPSE